MAPIILFTDEVTGLSPGFGGYASQFGYDFDGNLTGITAAGSSAVSFEYDGLDRQLGWQSGGSQLDYQLDGNTTLTETNQTTAWVNLYGNGLVSSGGESLLYDGLGAVRQTTNGSQNVAWSAAYYGFGQTIASGGSTGNHYQWGASSGYRSDGFGPADAAPLQKVGARYYDPELGVFLTRDTVLSQKPYAYCDGDPINFSDPSGHKSNWWQNLWNGLKNFFGGSVSVSYSGGSTTTTTITYTNNDFWTNGRGGGQQLHQTVTKTTTTVVRKGTTWKANL